MANFSCGIFPVNIAGPPCSGNGVCEYSPTYNRGVCVCAPFWHGDSDFQVTSNLTDCQINSIALMVLWSFFILVQIFFGIKYVPKVKWLFSRHFENVAKQKAKGKTYSYYQNKPLLALMPYFVFGYPSQLAYAIVQLATDTQSNLGKDPLLSAFYIIWRVTFFFGWFVFQGNFLATLLKAERKFDRIIRLNFILSGVVLVSVIAASICIVIPLANVIDPFDPFLVNVAIFFGACSLSFAFVVLQSMYILRKVVRILDRSYAISKDAKSKRLREKIVYLQTVSRNTAFLQFVIYGVFCAFPYLWNKHDWLLPFSWLAVLRTWYEILVSLVEESKESSSDAAGLVSSSKAEDSMIRKRTNSLLEYIANTVRKPSILSTTQNQTTPAGVAVLETIPSENLMTGTTPTHEKVFEISMKRASVGIAPQEGEFLPKWVTEEDSIARDMFHHSPPDTTE